jgi:hypothetical protein
MAFQHDFNDAVRAVQEGQLHNKSEAELSSMIKALASWQASGGPGSQFAAPAIDAIQKVLALKQKERHHEGEMVASRAATQEVVKALGRLERPHWTLTPTFWISVGILVVSVVILIVAVLAWRFPKNEQPIPNDKLLPSNSNSVARPTNLPPAKPPTQ